MQSPDPELLGDLYGELVRPRVARLLKLLKLDAVYDRAEGDSLRRVGADRPVVDLLGGYGSTLLGHNHPEVVQALETALREKAPVHAQASIRPGAARLAERLDSLMRRHCGDQRGFVTTLCNSGAEAVEAGLKHAFMEWQSRRARFSQALELERAELLAAGRDASGIERALEALERLEPTVVAVEGSFHGKTAGSVSVTTNLEFKGMYGVSPVRSVFLEREERLESARARLENRVLALPGGRRFSTVAAVLFEAIQGEGGIVCLSAAFAATLRRLATEHEAPLVADEIQCGLFRTGEFLATGALGVAPDYVLLGKSLGGGVAKVAALLVARERYNDRFGLVHTSTFGEDELSSRAALAALDVLEREAASIAERARRFEARVRDGIARIQKDRPGVVREVRGRGFLVGVELEFGDEAPVSTLLHTIHQAGLATYVYTSFLLERHGVRCGVTLSRPDTLRLEPSAFIREESVDRFLAGLAELCQLIQERRILKICSHFLAPGALDAKAVETVSPLRYRAVRAERGVARVGFLSHIVDDLHLRLMDPLFRAVGEQGRKRFMAKFGQAAGPVLYHEQLIEGANGRKVHIHCYGVFFLSEFFEQSSRAGDGRALEQVVAMAERARRDGMSFVGLGQFTSIVTRNGLLLSRRQRGLTTGNALTAGYACQAVEDALGQGGQPLRDARIGVVGAAGNICGAVTEVLAGKARALTLVVREGTLETERAKGLVARAQGARLRVTDRLEELADCDAVVIGTSAAGAVLGPGHLKENAVVMDVSVPSNIDPRVLSERKDVRCYHGGRARLPLGQSLRSDWLAAPPGETYACMAETLAAGLTGFEGPLSVGPIHKQHVLEAVEMAARAGFAMGTLKRATRA